MNPTEPRYLVLPGYGDSGPDHWQTRWEASDHRFQRVVQRDWDHPVADEWVATLEEAVARCPEGVVLVAHSLACLLVAHWATRTTWGQRVRGALLVGVPDPSSPVYPAAITGFDRVPLGPLPFPTWVVASSDDPFATLEFSQRCAFSWGARFVVAGALGHLNAASGLGDWPWGRSLLDEVHRRARPQRWAVVFTDTPDMLAIRRDREPLHLAYLLEHRDEVVLAGGCRSAPGEPFVGGLWVVETAQKSRVIELVEADPYFVPPFRSYRVTTWGKALDGDVIL